MISGIIKSADGTQLTVTVPQPPVPGTDVILIKSQNGDATSTDKFVYNSATTNTNAPAAPLNTTNVSQQIQTDIAKIQSSTFQDGQTGPKVLIEKIIRTPITGFENMRINVSTDNSIGVWAINKSVNVKVQLIGLVDTGNNIIKEEVIKEIGFITTGYVSDDYQSFYITSYNIATMIDESGEVTAEESKKTKKILGGVYLTTVPSDKNKQQLNSTYKFTMLKS